MRLRRSAAAHLAHSHPLLDLHAQAQATGAALTVQGPGEQSSDVQVRTSASINTPASMPALLLALALALALIYG